MSNENNLPPVSAVHLRIGVRQMGFNVDNVKKTYTWAPNFDDVYVGKEVKSSYVHSLWVGVVMTLVNLPIMLWRLLLKPIFGVIGVALAGTCVAIGSRLIGGLRGHASGIKVDAESAHAEHQRVMKEQLAKMFGIPVMPESEFVKFQAEERAKAEESGEAPKSDAPTLH